MIRSLKIHGFRGFAKEQTIDFAIPNFEDNKSGITFFVGGNNTGKTTILEALRAFTCRSDNPPSFSEGKRNARCENGKVHLSVTTQDVKGCTDCCTIDTVDAGGSSTNYVNGPLNIFVLPSRRFMNYTFGNSLIDRDEYIYHQQSYQHNRSASIDEFSSRLFKMQNNKEEFDKLIKSVLGYDLKWTIEQNDSGSYYLKLFVNGGTHSSEGLGDGIWSVFTICDALYDSKEGDIIAIDEPELSLHPAYQKKIMNLLKEYSSKRQIIICTHSPYFVDIDSLINGAKLHRTTKNAEGNIKVYTLSEESCKNLSGFTNDLCQPHTLGTEAKEIFFLEDKIIVTEGQEDVIMYKNASEKLDCEFQGTFFGWGAGGAEKIRKILMILSDLGYEKVSVIFDGDKADEKAKLERTDALSKYNYHIISTDDVRDKDAVCKPKKDGLLNKDGSIKNDKCKDEISKLIENINAYMEERQNTIG